jgi:hypothetical protein
MRTVKVQSVTIITGAAGVRPALAHEHDAIFDATVRVMGKALSLSDVEYVLKKLLVTGVAVRIPGRDLRVTVWHGESTSLFYVIDAEQDEVVATFHTPGEAEALVAQEREG